MNKKISAILVLAITSVFYIYPELVSSTAFNYWIDLPELYQITDCSEDERAILFGHQRLPVQAAVKIWSKSEAKNSSDCLSRTMKKVSAKGQITQLKWRNQNCALSQIQIGQEVLGTPLSGWAVCIPLPSGTDYFTMLCYAPSDKAYDVDQFMLSTLDSIMIDRGSFREPGIITSFAFPKKGQLPLNLEIAGTQISTFLDKDDMEANQFVVDREFEVFKLYINEQCWKEAWQRIYRMIAKDGMGRVKKPAFDISAALYEKCRTLDPENPDAAMAQTLLTWAQNFKYERKSASADKADFTNIPATITQSSGSDCDSRSMLLMILLKNMNIDSCMFISVDYSHAMLGVYLEGKQGQIYTLDQKDYLFGETTAKDITLGKISAKMQDRSKWIPVELYD